MLWRKSWLETRSRFLVGFALLAILAMGTVFNYPAVAKLRPLVRSMDTTTALGRAIDEAVRLEQTYRGFIWLQWFKQNLAQMIRLFAIILGSGGLVSKGSALFTLSLPVSRNRVLGSRAAIGLGELLILAVVPSLLIPLLSPAVGEQYGFADVVVHGACMFVGASAFFSVALLLSTVFADIWRPLLVACAFAIALSVAGWFVPALSRHGLFGAMVAESYYQTGVLPWPALAVSAGASAAMFYAAMVNFARRDF